MKPYKKTISENNIIGTLLAPKFLQSHSIRCNLQSTMYYNTD